MDDFILINEIEKRGQLYDHSDPKYKDKRQRDAGWRAVSEAVGITVVKCHGRWKDLRDQFSKKVQPRSGSAAGPQKEWKYSQALSFLVPHLQPRSSRSSLDQVDVEDWEALDLSHGEDVRDENDQHSQPDQHFQPGSSTSRPYNRPAARKRASAPAVSLEDRLLAMVQEPPQPMFHRVPQEEDEMLHFVWCHC
ncbi:transcription factor Adf-1-like [Clupea harengus]|uniref:Transcription factor Adf-1-like n=1 Tax=Clupea harengus TaxID=7950 RepID=A0A8M1KBD9_CLUHA|nr:transcription factor Adf-1-like [Clupea harengus]